MPGKLHAHYLVIVLLVGVLAVAVASPVQAQGEPVRDDAKKGDPDAVTSAKTSLSVLRQSDRLTRPGRQTRCGSFQCVSAVAAC